MQFSDEFGQKASLVWEISAGPYKGEGVSGTNQHAVTVGMRWHLAKGEIG